MTGGFFRVNSVVSLPVLIDGLGVEDFLLPSVFMPGLLRVRSTPGTAGEAVVTTPPQYFDLPMQLATAGLKAIATRLPAMRC